MRNTVPLNSAEHSSFSLELRAEDCGGRLSDIATLTVNVKPVCQPSWTGLQPPVAIVIVDIIIVIIIPAKARDYVFTGVGLSVCLSVCLLPR